MNALMTQHEKRAWAEETPDRPISDAHKLQSKIAGHKATRNLAKSTAQYAATMETEEKHRQEKGVFLEFRNGVYTEVFSRQRAISDFREGTFIVFSKKDIDALIGALELIFVWCSDDKKTCKLRDADGLISMISVSEINEGLKAYYIPCKK
jgi:hypothetical protein